MNNLRLLSAHSRFEPQTGAAGPQTAQRTARAQASGQAVTFDRARPLGAGTPVSARRITTDEFREKITEARNKILNAAGFDIEFQNTILKDPILATAFAGYLEQADAGKVAATPVKMQEAHFAADRQQVMAFLDLFAKKLDELKAMRESTPEALTQTGLKIIQRNTDIQESRESPLEMGPTLRELANLNGLSDAQRKPFLVRLAKAAVQSVALEANRTPEKRQAALTALTTALTRLTAMGEDKTDAFREYFGEAVRIAGELDGPQGRANRINVEAIRLHSTQPTEVKAGTAKLTAYRAELIERRDASQTKKVALPAETLAAYSAWLQAAKASRELFETLPDLIESVTGLPKEEGTYKPHPTEADLKVELIKEYTDSIGGVFPKLGTPEEKAAHFAACEHAQSLLIQILAHSPSESVSSLIGELTRHPEHVEKAMALLAPEFIPDTSARLQAGRRTVESLLDNGNVDAAYQLFSSPLFEAKDQFAIHRQMMMFIKAMEVGIARKMDVKCSEPALEWMATAHLRAIELASEYPFSDFKRVLTALSQPGALDAQGAVDFVAKLEKMFMSAKGGPVRMDFTAGMVGVLAQHPESLAAMNRAKDLVQAHLKLVTDGYTGARKEKFNEYGYDFDTVDGGLDLLQVLSSSEQLSGMLKTVAEKVAAMANASVRFTQRLPLFGEFANKDELARSLPLGSSGAEMAVALAPDLATTAYARELIASRVKPLLQVEVAKLEPAQVANLLRLEAAARLAVPNLITAKALVGLVKAFQAQAVEREALDLARTYYPADIIKEVLGQIDSADIRDYLEGKKRPKALDGGAEPDGAESIPVAVVGGGRMPTED